MLPEGHLPLTRDLHGYAIILDVRASTLYAALQRMLDAGLIEEVERRRTDDDPRRRYYSLTKYGREVARAEARRLERLTEMACGKRLLPGAAPSAHGRKA